MMWFSLKLFAKTVDVSVTPRIHTSNIVAVVLLLLIDWHVTKWVVRLGFFSRWLRNVKLMNDWVLMAFWWMNQSIAKLRSTRLNGLIDVTQRLLYSYYCRMYVTHHMPQPQRKSSTGENINILKTNFVTHMHMHNRTIKCILFARMCTIDWDALALVLCV